MPSCMEAAETARKHPDKVHAMTIPFDIVYPRFEESVPVDISNAKSTFIGAAGKED